MRDVTWSVAVNRLRTAVKLLPAFVPAFVICEAPFRVVPPPTTTAPIGSPAGAIPADSPGSCPGEIKSSARKSESRFVDEAWRKDVGFTQARHLLAQENIDQAQGFVVGVFAWLSSTV